jgi:hypothetical protein
MNIPGRAPVEKPNTMPVIVKIPVKIIPIMNRILIIVGVIKLWNDKSNIEFKKDFFSIVNRPPLILMLAIRIKY